MNWNVSSERNRLRVLQVKPPALTAGSRRSSSDTATGTREYPVNGVRRRVQFTAPSPSVKAMPPAGGVGRLDNGSGNLRISSIVYADLESSKMCENILT